MHKCYSSRDCKLLRFELHAINMSINGKSRGYTHIVHRTTHWISGINFLRQTFDSTGCCLSIRCVVSVGVCWIILICAGRALWIDWDWCGWWATVLLDAIFQRHRVRRAGKLDGCRTAVATDPRSLYAGDMERESVRCGCGETAKAFCPLAVAPASWFIRWYSFSLRWCAMDAE